MVIMNRPIRILLKSHVILLFFFSAGAIKGQYLKVSVVRIKGARGQNVSILLFCCSRMSSGLDQVSRYARENDSLLTCYPLFMPFLDFH